MSLILLISFGILRRNIILQTKWFALRSEGRGHILFWWTIIQGGFWRKQIKHRCSAQSVANREWCLLVIELGGVLLARTRLVVYVGFIRYALIPNFNRVVISIDNLRQPRRCLLFGWSAVGGQYLWRLDACCLRGQVA